MNYKEIAKIMKELRNMETASDFSHVVSNNMNLSGENRVWTFLNLWKYIPDSCFYEVYKECLSTCENKSDYRRFFKPELLAKATKLNTYDTVDNPHLKSIADTEGYITIYHGNAGKTMSGACSWSLSKDISIFFGNRNALFGKLNEYYVVTGRVKLENIIAYITDRKEEEIVVLPKNVEYSFKAREVFERDPNRPPLFSI